MTDKEIIEHLATDFMGWQFTDDLHTIGEYSATDVQDTVWFRRDNGSIGVTGAITCQKYDPLHDPAAVALVLDEVERRGFKWEWEYGPGILEDLDYTFVMWKEDAAGSGDSDTRYRAVCLAVLKAIGK